jgi:hypothetical protein
MQTIPAASYRPTPLEYFLKGHRLNKPDQDGLRFLIKLSIFITAWSDVERGLEGILEDIKLIPNAGIVFSEVKEFPWAFGRRLNLFHDCFCKISALEPAQQAAQDVETGMRDQAGDRNQMIHGIWTPLPHEGPNVFAVSLGKHDKNNKSVTHARYDEEVLDQMAAKTEAIAGHLYNLAVFVRRLGGQATP